jgi:hypothetical protein
MDETSGTTASDSSGYGNHGTFVNMVGNHWTSGMKDGALDFFGYGNKEYVNCGTGGSLDIVNDFTLAAWVQLAPGTDGRYAGIAGRLTRKNTDADYWGFALVRHSSNVFRLWVADGDTSGITGSASSDVTYTDSLWHHVVGVRKGKTNYLYVDGVQQKSTSSTEFIPSKEFFHIGRQYNYLDDRYFMGLIDDVRLYNRALSADEILVLAGRPKAHDPSPADGQQNVPIPLLQWQAGTGGRFHDLYLGTTPELGQAQFVGRQFINMYFSPTPLTPGTLYYWRVDEVEGDGVTVHTGDVWSFSATFDTAYGPNPSDGAKWVDPNVVLTWTPSITSQSHDVYFSTNRDDVAAGAAAAFQKNVLQATYSVGMVAAGTTCYWRVDECVGQVKKAGGVWSFTTLGPGAGVTGEYFNNMAISGKPALKRIDPDIDFNWGDPGGPGDPIGVNNFSCRWTGELEVPYSEKYTFITATDDGVRLWVNNELIIDNWTDHSPTENAGKMALAVGQVYTLVMEMYENTGGATAQLSWTSPSIAKEIVPPGPLQPPLRARNPRPVQEATDVTQAAVLYWTAGEKAAEHDVYLGTDAAVVAEATPATAEAYVGRQALDAISYDPGPLEWGKTYYWRVDEVNDAEAASPWKGSIWSFTTATFLVIDDFEGYTSDVGNRIFQTWIDGMGYTEPAPGNAGNGTGSTVGTDADPWVEVKIVHSGKQSLPMDYNNTVSPYYSEAERAWTAPQNWTVKGGNTLTLSVKGQPPRFAETAAGRYAMSSTSGDIWGTADQFRYAYRKLSGDGWISAKINTMTNPYAWAKAGVMVRESLDADSAQGFAMITPDGRRAFQNRSMTGGNSLSAHSATGVITLPFWVKVERKGNQVTAYYSTDGKAWIKQPDNENTGTDASPNPQTIMMGTSICVGLAVTSNSTSAACIVEFSDVTTGGSVSGQWQVADIGGGNLGNDPDTLYVAVQDSAGKIAVITSADDNAVLSTDWTEWSIPLSQFTGVNMAAVKKMFIGVGDRKSPQPDGAGTVYIDDIRVVSR